MARILILRDLPERCRPLRNTLQAHHELSFVESMTEAMKVLHENRFDLIICSAHLDKKSVFDFIRAVKDDAELHGIPFLCFSKERTPTASFLNNDIERASLLLGADKYLSMDYFCDAKQYSSCADCPFLGELCGFEDLRQAVEDLIAHGALSKSKR